MAVKLLLILMCFPIRCPSLASWRTMDWQPTWTLSSQLQLTSPTVGFFTHCSLKFDPLRDTAPAVGRAVSDLKAGGHAVVYLHDRYNPSNPAWTYLYSDWHPTAYLRSDIGHIDIDVTNVRHAICLGGFYEQCERSTVTDLLRLWRRDARDQDFRLTQVTDGVFTVLTYLRSGDWYERPIRRLYQTDFRSRHPKAIITLERVLQEIGQEEVFAEFLRRQLPPLPPGINIMLDVHGVVYPWKLVRADAPTLTLAWRRSDNLLNYEAGPVDYDRVVSLMKRGYSPYPSGRVFPGRRVLPPSGRFPSGSYPPGTIIRSVPSSPRYPGSTPRRVIRR
ncbi:MAG: hypothetical protein NXI04_23260 [Planctomycetaceae bacterium]|nr:hypothetical protein [Planctomycetaceae bacterium]